MKKTLLLLPAFPFLLSACMKTTASIEKRKCGDDSGSYEHVLVYGHFMGKKSICIEEEFDLAEGEISGVELCRGTSGLSFILFTEKNFRYSLDFKGNGKWTLHRFY